MAALWKLPVIYVMENNKWAIGMSHERATSVPEIYTKGAAFGLVGVEVDGMDVLAVRDAAKTAVARARAGEGPTIIEALTYRFRGHSLADPDEMRAKEEKDFWFSRDPIRKLGDYLTAHNLVSKEELEAIDKRIDAVVVDAVEFAESSPEPDASELYDYIFAD